MGEVWQATDTVLGRDVAVKTLHAGRAGDPGFQTRFRHEARAMAVLHHPGVADVYDYGQSGPDAYIVMAHVNGEPLNQRIAERGRLTAAETMSIVTQAGRALEAAHQAGIVHRDVKPGNLIIRPDGTVVLVDFGVARSAESAALTGAKEVVGTALYIAPEQVSKEVTGPSADIYALGTVAYHCLAGHPPFLGESPIAVAMQHVHDDPPPLPEDVPPAVRTLVATAMAKDPADRFSSAAAMAEAAEHAVTGSGDTTAILAATSARRASPGSGTAILPALTDDQDDRPRRTPLLVAAAILALVVAGVALALVMNPGLLPGSRPPAVSESNTPSQNQSPGSTKRQPTGAPAGNAPRTTGPSKTTTPTPSATPSTAATTTAPEQTATTEPEQTEPTTDNGGGNSGPGGGGGDNSGNGGGERGRRPGDHSRGVTGRE